MRARHLRLVLLWLWRGRRQAGRRPSRKGRQNGRRGGEASGAVAVRFVHSGECGGGGHGRGGQQR